MGTTGVLDPRTMPDELHSVTGITQWYTRQLEQIIREAPEQYWWIHRRWRDYKPRRKTNAKRPTQPKAA